MENIEANGHTAYCNRWRVRYADELAEYEIAHPNYCRKCRGLGGTELNYDPSPRGISLSPGFMTEIDPCTDCVSKGICPLCGQSTLDDDGERCMADGCGWNFDDADRTVAPYFECACWETINDNAIEQYEREYKGLDEIYADLVADREADAFEDWVDGVRPDSET